MVQLARTPSKELLDLGAHQTRAFLAYDCSMPPRAMSAWTGVYPSMKTGFWILAFAAVAALLAGIVYCWSNRSGHSGFDPMVGLWPFGAVFLIGLMGRMITRGRWLSARFAEVTGFVGMAFVPFVMELGILNQYEAWIAAGMPERNPQADWLLAGFLVGGLGGALVVACLVTPRAEARGNVITSFDD